MRVFRSFIVVAILFLAGFAPSAVGQTTDSLLRDKKITIKLKKQSLGKVFLVLMNQFDVPIGFEESTLDRDHDDFDFETNILDGPKTVLRKPKMSVAVKVEPVFIAQKHFFDLDFEDTRLEVVMNQIVRSMKNYDWNISDGVVNIYPIRGRDPRFSKLLDLKIKKLEDSDSKPPVFMIRNLIVELPEFVSFSKENNLPFGTYRTGYIEHLDRLLSVKLNFSDLKFRDLLNQITGIKRGGWILKLDDFRGPRGVEYIDVDI